MSRSTKALDGKAASLQSVLGLTGLRARDLELLASLFDELHLDAGEALLREGQPATELFLIVDGEAAVSLGDHALATLGPGEFVGEMTLFDRAPCSATVTALTPMRTLVAGAQSFGALLDHPAVLRRLAATLARRLRTAQGSPAAWSA